MTARDTGKIVGHYAVRQRSAFYVKAIVVTLAVLPVLLAGCVCGVPHGSASTKPPKLEMKERVFSLDEEKYGNLKETQVDAEIRNVGETTVLLPTKGIGPSWTQDGGIYTINFSTDVVFSTSDGFKIPIAKSDLAIVELRPREAVVLSYTLLDTNVAPKSVGVRYSISKEFGERYGTWHGEITPISRNGLPQ